MYYESVLTLMLKTPKFPSEALTETSTLQVLKV